MTVIRLKSGFIKHFLNNSLSNHQTLVNKKCLIYSLSLIQ